MEELLGYPAITTAILGGLIQRAEIILVILINVSSIVFV